MMSHTSQSNKKIDKFWKHSSTNLPGSIKPVYGAQHPPLQKSPSAVTSNSDDSGMSKVKLNDSFSAFEFSTSDAWDTAADDDEVINMANCRISLKDARSSAKAVIDEHTRRMRESLETSHNTSQSPDSEKVTATPSSTLPGSGPGLGVRLNNSWTFPKTVPVRHQTLSPHGTKETAENVKLEKAVLVLFNSSTDLDELRNISWSGLPKPIRPVTWKILAGYLPPSKERREPTLRRKREEYFGFVDQYYDTRQQEMYQETFRQILKDVPRMTCLAHLFKQENVQQIFERILYIWAIRHPASGYVQGINDLVTPFFIVFLSEYIDNDIEIENCNLNELPSDTLSIIEADSFWCTSKLLEGIQDNYTFAQPGIQAKVKTLRELIKRVNAPLHEHLERHSVEYLQFAFRWMNNLLMREIPLHCIIRLWDTYLAEPDGFATFHLYVCAAFLLHFSKDIQREKDFQGILMMLQNLPTHNWSDSQINVLLAEAYSLKYTFADAPSHLSSKS